MNKGRGKDHVWQFVKYKFDTAIYAQCSCGFHYACCTTKTVIPMRVDDVRKCLQKLKEWRIRDDS